jgi:SH3-like domain-containing protein
MVDWRSLVPSISLPSLPQITLPSPPWNTGTPAPTVVGPIARVDSAGLNMRSGPGTAYESIAAYERGDRMEVLAKDGKGEWLKVKAPDGKVGWMSARFLAVRGSLDDVPVEQAAPTP